MEGSSVSSAVNCYDGIFKFVHAENAKGPFLEARKLIASNKWKEAEDKFLETKEKCENPVDVSNVSVIIEEMARYKKQEIPTGTKVEAKLDWDLVKNRSLERIDEGHYALPQGIFILSFTLPDTQKRIQVLGRKTFSNLWLQDKIPELFCSQIRPDMLLGLFCDWRVTERKVIAFFNPLTASEKLGVFQQVVSTGIVGAEIVYPFPILHGDTKLEITSPEEGWDVDPNFDHTLSDGETHIRDFTINELRRLQLTSHRLYDPACSTGVFLSTLKKTFPNCTTIGQDLSQQMCNVAKCRLDQVYCSNAMQPQILAGSADVVFNRFLNSEVVNSEAAEQLLHALLPTVAPGGIMITFGHTPVLLSSSNFRMIDGFELKSCIGVAVDNSSIFQYYVLKRLE